MQEIEVRNAERYTKRKRENAVGKNLLKTLTEPITNSDDSYSRQITDIRNKSGALPITVQINAKTRLVRIIDNAEGLSENELAEKFKEYGADKSGASTGAAVRGIFGQGISDVLFYHKNGTIKSVKDGNACECKFYERAGRQFIRISAVSSPTQKWNFPYDRGTIIEFNLNEGTSISDFETFARKLNNFYMLRLINQDDKRELKLVFKDGSGTRRSVTSYSPPEGKLVDHKDIEIPFRSYPPIRASIELYRSNNPLVTAGDEKENGLLVFDEKNAVYDLTFFGLDRVPGADKYFGQMKVSGLREIIIDKINDPDHPEEILTDTRDGFNKKHELYTLLEDQVSTWLYPIFSQELKKESHDGAHPETSARHKQAFSELNKLYKQLAGDSSLGGTIKSNTKKRPAGGLEFARSSISITAGKKYGLQIAIDTRLIPVGSVIKISSRADQVGVSPLELIVTDASNNDEILIKTISVIGTKPDSADTITAHYAAHRCEAVVSVVPEQVFVPSNGIEFNPDFITSLPNHETQLSLYIDLALIPRGSTINLRSSSNDIELTTDVAQVPKTLWSVNGIGRVPVRFRGIKAGISGLIEAYYSDYSCQAKIDVKERAPKPNENAGKFRDWDFDDRLNIQQVDYDPIPTSPTYGYILVNPKHPINKRYFGSSPTKSSIEDSQVSQLYLAELVLTECLNIMIPEALQTGGLPRRYGDYDVLTYQVQKKMEFGPKIYAYFVNEQDSLEAKKSQKRLAIENGLKPNKKLKPRHIEITNLYLGLNGNRPHTLEEVGKKYKLTRERIRQIVDKVLKQVETDK